MSLFLLALLSIYTPTEFVAASKKTLTAEEVIKKAPLIRQFIGEKAVYDGYVFKAGIRVHVGVTTISVIDRKTADPTVVLKATAEGGKFGYNVKMDFETVLDHKTYLPRIAKISQTGSERRFKKLLFQKNKIFYNRLKHCYDPNCKNPKHMVERITWFGPFPTGKEIVHCPKCKNLDHYVWKLSETHKVHKQFFDMLSGTFLARTCNFKLGSSFVLPLVQDHDLWLVKVTSIKEEKMKVEAGTFDCVKIILEPVNADSKKKDRIKFKGLFGLNGTINIWLEKKTRLPVRILGSIPFAFMEIHCEACLRKYIKPKKVESGKVVAKLVSSPLLSGH